MATNEQMKRLEQIEAQARAVEFERSLNDPEMRAHAAREAERHGLDVDDVIAETLEIVQRISEIGETAWRAELAAEEREAAASFGISLERYREIDWDAEHADWVAGGSIPGAWRGRDWNTWPARLVTPSGTS